MASRPVPAAALPLSPGPASSLPGAWGRIDWATPVPPGFLIPEHHYRMRRDCGFLTEAQRARLNHLSVRFSCESFIHFERYVIEYLERYPHRLGPLPEKLVRRFIDEEHVHVAAFWAALETVRPDLHGGKRLRMHRWTWVDRLLMRVAPTVSFFLLAALFEEMTLFVPVVMDERPEQSWPPLHEAMRLHAKEERGHVAIDERVLAHAARTQPRWSVAAQALLSLLLMRCVQGKMDAAWARGVADFAREEGLSGAQRRALLGKRLSLSDELGMKSFLEKLRTSPLPGAGLLRAVLSRLA
jgi:hypothetical protein